MISDKELNEIFNEWEQFLSWCYENNDKTIEIHRDKAKYVMDYTRKLQSNWDSLRENLEWEINDYNGNIDIETRNIDSEFLRGIAWEAQELLDKMNELEKE